VDKLTRSAIDFSMVEQLMEKLTADPIHNRAQVVQVPGMIE